MKITVLHAFLFAAGAFSIAAGLAYLIRPIEMSALVGVAPLEPVGLIEVRGFYGGQLVGLGAATLLGVWRRRFVVTALVLLVASLGGTALGRLYGMAAGGSFPPVMAGLLALELVTATIALVLLARSGDAFPRP